MVSHFRVGVKTFPSCVRMILWECFRGIHFRFHSQLFHFLIVTFISIFIFPFPHFHFHFHFQIPFPILNFIFKEKENEESVIHLFPLLVHIHCPTHFTLAPAVMCRTTLWARDIPEEIANVPARQSVQEGIRDAWIIMGAAECRWVKRDGTNSWQIVIQRLQFVIYCRWLGKHQEPMETKKTTKTCKL